MRYKTRLNFTLKLFLSITAISVSGLLVMFLIVNTTVRGVIYNNAIDAARRDARYTSREIDAWFGISYHMVNNLARAWPALCTEHIRPIAHSLLSGHDFLVNVHAGFSDGRLLSGSYAGSTWSLAAQPWYRDAITTPGRFVTTIPYRAAEHGIVVTVAKWVPDIGGTEAVIAVDIKIDYVINMVNRHRPATGGYLILAGPRGEIISHPNAAYAGHGEPVYLRDILNGERLVSNIIPGAGVQEFYDRELGLSYIMTFPLEVPGWTLTAIIPASAIAGQVFRHLLVIMLTLAAVMVVLFIFTMFFISLLTKNVEESRVMEAKLRTIIDNMPLGSYLRDRNFNVLECNKAAAKLFDLSGKEEYLKRFSQLTPEFQPDGRQSSRKGKALITEAFETGYSRFEWMYQKLNGSPVPAEVTLVRVDWNGEDVLIAFIRDLREHYEARKREREVARRMQAMLDSSPLLCTIFDENCNVLEVNQEALRLLEIPDKQIYIDDYFAFLPEFQPDGTPSRVKIAEMFKAAFEKGHGRFEWTYKTIRGELIPCEETLVRVKLADENLLISYARDLREINNAVSMAKQLEKAAFTDALTGAHNRRYFMETAEKELQKCIERNLSYSIIIIDVDYFKKINDTHGHPIGDEVLKILFARVQHTLKHDTLVARYGGEEFAIMLSDLSPENVVKTAQRIKNSIEAYTFTIGALEIDVTISLGAASKTERFKTLADIINNADKALYQAKETGRNRVVYYDGSF